MSRWFRFYDDAINDPKILKLPEEMRWHWVAILCIASKNDGILPATDDVALMLRVKTSAAAAIIAGLKNAGLLDNEDGTFQPHNWNGRQYKSDVSTERVKRFRNGKRNVPPTVTQTVSETPPETEQITEQNTDARAGFKNPVGDFCQAIVRVYAECNSPVLPETSRCVVWLSQGYDAEVCLAVIAEILRRKPSISSLSYFDKPIADAHAKKAPPRKQLSSGPIAPDWDAAAKLWVSVKRWPRGYGNDPESPACRAPPDILRKYGIQSTGASHG